MPAVDDESAVTPVAAPSTPPSIAPSTSRNTAWIAYPNDFDEIEAGRLTAMHATWLAVRSSRHLTPEEARAAEADRAALLAGYAQWKAYC